ncbi:histidine phosphatase family protein [Marivirga sp. S37H4]|uniref:Histidine phosphatase family protein n=2 Tax=Marivirga aurantiaca TaxID=2802615 RepID=A0A934WWB9_9BACT|nr:histidine phosphatase family protein [Marivirga aurantiaca]
MVKDLIIVRHGQTDFNLKGIVQGSGVDSSINETGKKQAVAFHKFYKDYAFDKAYISQLKRTQESIQGFINEGLPYEKLGGLNEISWGSREGKLFTPEENNYYHSMIERWQNGETSLPVEGGEAPDDVAIRQLEAMDYIMKQSNEKKVLICMHGRAMRILMCKLLNYPLCNMDTFIHQNLGVYHLRATKSMYQLVKHNDVRHLEGI